MQKKILIITERFHPEKFIINDIAAYWTGNGFEVSVLTQAPSYPLGKVYTGYKNRLFKKETYGKVRIYRFFTVCGYRKSLFFKLLNYFSFSFMSSVISIFIAKKFDTVFVYQTGPLTLAAAAAVIRKFHKKPVTIWTQDLWPESVYSYGFKKTRLLKFCLNKFVKFIYSNSDTILVSCKSFTEKIKKIVPSKKISYFPNWPLINCSLQKKSEVKLSDKFNFTFAGNIGKLQNLENVIAGFELFSKQNKNAQLNIFGDGSNFANLKQFVENRRIYNVVFHGRKEPAEMPAILSASDVLLISLKKGSVGSLTVPGKFQVYLTAKKPIFCIMEGETEKIVKEHNLGVVSKPDDIEDIAKGFKTAVEFEKNTEFVKSVDNLLQNEFSKEKIMSGITKVVLGNKKK